MGNEQTFRMVLLVGFLIVAPVGIYHRLKSVVKGEKLDRRQEGLFILFTLRLLGISVLLGFIAYIIDPAWMAWASIPLPVWLRWTGAGIGVLAALLITWTFRNLGKNLTDTVVTRKEHTLVTTGPYRWMRHPFYTSGALASLSGSLVAANAYLLIAGSLVFTLLVIRTRKEEDRLVARFGDQYRQYMQRTGRFFPRVL